jgi:tetratricopeptide (TPR) repeat protein
MSSILPIFLLAALCSESAEKAWRAGQAAMENDRFDEAVGQFQLSLRLDPKFAQAHLSLAAAYLAVSQDANAVTHLKSYLAAHPEHFPVRWHLAEAFLRLGKRREARAEVARYVVEHQVRPALGDEPLIRAHTLLMEIAEDLGDEYEERLNRGIGLLLLGKKRLEAGGPGAKRSAEELLCRSASELAQARLLRPTEARPAWYLHSAWSALSQTQPARRWLRQAVAEATPGALTPGEKQSLILAAQEARLPAPGK